MIKPVLLWQVYVIRTWHRFWSKVCNWTEHSISSLLQSCCSSSFRTKSCPKSSRHKCQHSQSHWSWTTHSSWDQSLLQRVRGQSHWQLNQLLSCHWEMCLGQNSCSQMQELQPKKIYNSRCKSASHRTVCKSQIWWHHCEKKDSSVFAQICTNNQLVKIYITLRKEQDRLHLCSGATTFCWKHSEPHSKLPCYLKMFCLANRWHQQQPHHRSVLQHHCMHYWSSTKL